jgi:pimeloyl-ACP methyl ester carboxylesterase
LAAHLPRLAPLPSGVEVRRFGTIEEGYDLVRSALLRHAGNAPAPAVAPARPLPGRVWQDYVTSLGIALRVVRTGAGAGRTLVLQHAAQSSARVCREWGGCLGAGRPVVAIELPGHGETDCRSVCELENPKFLAALVKGALDVLGVTDCDFIGAGAGAAVQVEVARHWPSLARSLTLIGALDVTRHPELQAALLARYAPPEADSHGGYLLRAWHEARDHLLFFPWYERRRACALAESPYLTPQFLQTRTVDALLAGAAGVALRRAEIGYPLLARLADLHVEPRHMAPPWEPRHAHSRALASASKSFLTLSRDPARWLADIASFMDWEPT